MRGSKEEFAVNLNSMIRSMDPMEVMCLCRGVPRHQLSEGQCDPEACVTRNLAERSYEHADGVDER